MLRFADSCQHYSTAQIGRKWTSTTGSVAIVSTGGRNNGPQLRFTGGSTDYGASVSKTIDSQQTWIIGFRFKMERFPTDWNNFLKIVDTATTHINISIVPNSGILYWSRGTTGVGIASKPLAINQLYYIEVKAYIHDSSGTLNIRVNGESVLSYTGDTRNGANASANIITFGCQYNDYSYISDIYMADAQAGNVTDFIGDCRIDDLYFTANGYSSQFTPSTGSNYQNVDDNPSDDDTTYNESSTAGHIDSYTTTTLGFTPATIQGVQAVYTLRKDDAGARSFKRNIRKSATNYQGSSTAVTTSYAMYQEMIEDDPASATNWTTTDLESNVEWGLEVV